MSKINYIKTFFRQVCQTIDIVLDFTNGLGYINTANLVDSEEYENGTTYKGYPFEEKKNSSLNENERFHYYGYITIGLMWAPAVAYFLIFLMRILNKKSKQRKPYLSLDIFLLIISVSPLAPLIPLASSLLILSSNSWPTVNTVLLISLMEGSLEASMQVIWQGYIINAGAAETKALVLYDSQRINKISLSHHTVAYLSIASSILMTSFSSISCFFPSWRDLLDKNKKSKTIGQLLLILSSQAFRTISIIVLISYFDIFSVPIFVVIFISNFIILKKHFFDKKENSLKIQEKILLLFLNSLASIPMVFYYGRSFVDTDEKSNDSTELEKCIPKNEQMKINCKESDTQESAQSVLTLKRPSYEDNDSNDQEKEDNVSNDQEKEDNVSNDQEKEDQEGIDPDGVEKTIIKRTNILLTIPTIVLWCLLNSSKHFKYNKNFLITQDLKTFNDLALFVLVPFLVTSTILSTNLNQTKMRKTKIALSFLSSVLSYIIAIDLLIYFNKSSLFSQCSLSNLYTKQEFFDFSQCQNIEDIFNELSDDDKWVSFIGNIPNVLLSILILLFFLSFIMIVVGVQTKKSTCAILVVFAILSTFLTIWSGYVVYSLGFPVNNESQDEWWSSARCDFGLWNFAFYILPVVMLFNLVTVIVVLITVCQCCNCFTKK